MNIQSTMSERKKKLLAKKEKLLEEINDLDRQIESVEAKASIPKFVYKEDSSDSDTEILGQINTGPSLAELLSMQSKLSIHYLATQELTCLQILQSEVNMLVEAPVLNDYTPKTEDGLWREVMVDCRLDVVPFVITFYVHQPTRVEFCNTYFGLEVNLVKKQHSCELADSVLSDLRVPSDVVEVIRSYSAAHRSRRASLTAIANKYPDALYIDLLTEGGYLVKYSGVLRMSWVLVNKWSPLVPFHHSMKLHLEYVEKPKLKQIQQIFKLLSDPTIDTDERTLLLDKVITKCLETEKVPESMDSDLGSKNTLEESDINMIAQPNSLQKKTKPKGKENEPKNQKRSNSNNDDSTKRAKMDNGMAKKVSKDISVKGAKSVTNKKKIDDNVNKNMEIDSDASNDKDGNVQVATKNKNTNKAAQKEDTSPDNVASNNNDIVVHKNKNTNKTVENNEKYLKSVASISKDVNGKGAATLSNKQPTKNDNNKVRNVETGSVKATKTKDNMNRDKTNNAAVHKGSNDVQNDSINKRKNAENVDNDPKRKDKMSEGATAKDIPKNIFTKIKITTNSKQKQNPSSKIKTVINKNAAVKNINKIMSFKSAAKFKAGNTDGSNVGSIDSNGKASRIPKKIPTINKLKNVVRMSPRHM